MIFATKVRNLHPYLQAMLMCSGVIWNYTAPIKTGPRNAILYILLGYALISLSLLFLRKKRLFRTENLIFTGQFIDAFMIMLIMRFTGGIESQFHLVYFPLVALISVYTNRWGFAISGLWYALCFILGIYSARMDIFLWQIGLFRLFAIWAVGIVAFSISYYMRNSENRLLNTLDILNERTWELESSQDQLSNIYETTRALSGILNLEALLSEILRTAQNSFRYRKCMIYLTKFGEEELYLYAGLDNENRHIYKKPEPYGNNLNDVRNLRDTGSIIKRLSTKRSSDVKNQIDVPLVSRGKVIGIMQVVSESGNPVTPRERRLLMIFANSSAIAIDNSLLHTKTQELTITDELTDLYNFRYFKNRLSDELKRADRYRQKLSILMLDLDYFKLVNDRYGHQTGNVILQETAGIIRQCVRDVDVVARYGGEEFTVILPQTDETDATIIAERIRETVAKTYFPNNRGSREIQVTISIGGCTYPDGIHTLDQLLEKADKILYKAKAAGRNMVLFAGKDKKRSTEFIHEQ